MAGVVGFVMGLLEIRNIIIFNLVLQSTLTLLSPMRKTSSSGTVQMIIWLAYTVAGLAADYAVGLATRATMGNTTTKDDQSLIALWASFIFLQVVGPDSITAFSMEDTKSWFRSSFRVFLTGAVLNRVILVLLPKNRLAFAVYSIFFAGLAKYIERSQSLFFGNLNRFKTFTKPFSIGGRRGRLPTRAEDIPRVDSFEFFQTCKRIFANVDLAPQQCTLSRDYFLTSEAGARTGLSLDISCLRATRFFVWVSVDKHEFLKVDIRVTYTLVLSALFFDLVSFLRILFLDWTTASVLNRSTTDPEDRMSLWVKLIYKPISQQKKFPSCRWSKSMSQYSLIMFCTTKYNTDVENVLDWFKIKDFVYNFKNMSAARFDDKLRDLLFNILKYSSMHAEALQAPKNQSSYRFDWILRVCYRENLALLTFFDSWFKESMKFEKVVLLWHVATELCYYAYASDDDGDQGKEHREFNKVISNYMAYLLLREETLMSEVAGEAKITFQRTCDEVVKVLIHEEANKKGLKDKSEKVVRACKMIVIEDSSEEVLDQSVDEYSVLEDARRLTKELKGMTEQGIDMWEVMSKVWVELLCYAACNCKASEHACSCAKVDSFLPLCGCS